MPVSDEVSNEVAPQESVELNALNDNGGDKRTRFQVNKVKNETPERTSASIINISTTEDEEEDDDDNIHSVTERTRLNSESDTKYAKSFRHLTREALPRLDNYRNIMSLQAANRPTLDELHNATLPNKVDSIILTVYLNRSIHLSILLLAVLSIYTIIVDSTFLYMDYQIAGDQIGFIGVIRINMGITYVASIAVLIEYTGWYIIKGLEKRLIRLNALLKTEEENLKNIFRRSTYQNCDSIVTLRAAYLELMDAHEELNDFLAPNTLIAFISVFFLFLSSPYMVILALEGKRRGGLESFATVLELGVHFVRIMLFIEPSYSCLILMETMKTHVCKILSLDLDYCYRKEMDRFAMVLCLRNFKFSVCGFFNVNRFLLTSLIGTVTTYLTILLQYQKND